MSRPLKPTILVAEDAEDLLELMQFLLEDAGYQVVPARNGREAVERAREHHPALAILDFFMPIENGMDAARVMKGDARLKEMPLVACSAYLDAINDDGHLFAAHVAKPYMPETLLETVARVLATPGPQQ